MEYMGVNELREKFLSFFESKEHLRLASASLVPHNDKSLLLINSGMAPLKPYFTGQQIPPRKRVTTCQKCIRTGDIENVGKTARHGTFFEMLGNFSFGDYFKEEAIPWAWEFFTEVLKLPEDRLYVSVFEDDDEAYEIWNKKVGIPEEKIFRMGRDDNFWEHGVGPCGPCSEIYYDKGEEYGCGKPGCTVGCDCDRYMEIWNLVFTQFDKQEDGSYPRLEHPNIDTGMGLERIATVMQNVESIFDVDTVKAIRDAVCAIAGKKYHENHEDDVSIRVITDHVRSMTFMTADGVLPSNNGRGYVLRRLLRRAARHGKLLGIDRTFLTELSQVVIDNSGDAYPELREKQATIQKIISTEEENFYKTLDKGLEKLNEYMGFIKKDSQVLDGRYIFKLYDTYGFPTDLTEDILTEHGFKADLEGFIAEMDLQKKKARDARETDTYMGVEETVFNQLDPALATEFTGYTSLVSTDSVITALVAEDEIAEGASAGANVTLLLDKTPFYAEMGGQIGDTGIIKTDSALVEIHDTTKFGGNKFLHAGVVKSGEIKVGDRVTAQVDENRRIAIARNHTATHILQKALREVLGDHVEQAGSYVSDERLRFDFTHFESISYKDLRKVEEIVNDKILSDLPVTCEEMDIEDAKKLGAMALFGEKYGKTVRVVSVGDYSIEFCGGTHLKNSAAAGAFKILSESGIAAGVRRIEATTGYNTLRFYNTRDKIQEQISGALKTNDANMMARITDVLDENKHLKKELEALKASLSKGKVDDIEKGKEIIGGIAVICGRLENADMNTLRNASDKLKDKNPDCVVILGGTSGEKVSFVVSCSNTAVKAGVKAGDIVKTAAVICGGGGGGRPNMAQAGGKDPSKTDEALKAAKDKVKEILG
ncbi:MAG: alanine--tRNA ligase [Clostridiales bacterium]|nr:alanine--tRNA ligase [Clostridiales bacterium]